MRDIRVVLVSTYELGRQPFGLASPGASLRQAGAAVRCLDLAIEPLDAEAIAAADLVAFHLPMHTATRLAADAATQVRAINPGVHLCFYGLYAPVNEPYLRALGGQTILGGEFEPGLTALVQRLAAGAGDAAQCEPLVSLARHTFVTPDRAGLPALARYAQLDTGTGERRVAGYTEASRGCKHRCRHCPIAPVYGGVFRVVPRAVVLDDIAQQVAAGARHISFGDPDFFNGIGHALPLAEALHARFPDLTYDVTIKVEHLLTHAARLPCLRETGCLFVTSAVESFDDAILARFDKGHTRADVARAVALCRQVGLTLAPTFVTFTPWTTLAGYLDLLYAVLDLGLVPQVAPIQYAIRLLIPAGSRLLELPEMRAGIGPFDDRALAYGWANPDPRVDRLYEAVRAAVQQGDPNDRPRQFAQVWRLAHVATGQRTPAISAALHAQSKAPVPKMSEPWFC